MPATGFVTAAFVAATLLGGPSASATSASPAPPSTQPPASSPVTSPVTAPVPGPKPPPLELRPPTARPGTVVSLAASGLPTAAGTCTLLVDDVRTGSCQASGGAMTGSFVVPPGAGPTHDVLVCLTKCAFFFDRASQDWALRATLGVATPTTRPTTSSPAPGSNGSHTSKPTPRPTPTLSPSATPTPGVGWWPPSHRSMLLLGWVGGGGGTLLLLLLAIVVGRRWRLRRWARRQPALRAGLWPDPPVALGLTTAHTAAPLHAVRVLLTRQPWRNR